MDEETGVTSRILQLLCPTFVKRLSCRIGVRRFLSKTVLFSYKLVGFVPGECQMRFLPLILIFLLAACGPNPCNHGSMGDSLENHSDNFQDMNDCMLNEQDARSK